MNILRDGKLIELTDEELRQAYWEAHRNYLMSDISCILKENEQELSTDQIQKALNFCVDHWDSNLSHWDNIGEAIAKAMS